MKDEMIYFYNQSVDRNLCHPFNDMWHQCKSKKQLIDFCLRLDSIKYMAESRAKGWGLSTEYIKDVFKKYINGNYVAEIYFDEECYRTAELYCGYDNIINTRADYIHIMDSDCRINIFDWQVLFIYVSGKSNISISMGKNSIVYVTYYDDTCEIKHNADDVKDSKIIIKMSKYNE